MPRAPDLGAHLDILRALLATQLERLGEARTLERERGFVFPETTVIAKDVARLSGAVHLGAGGPEDPEPAAALYDADGPVDLEALVCEVGV